MNNDKKNATSVPVKPEPANGAATQPQIAPSQQNQSQVVTQPVSLAGLLSRVDIRKRFDDMLGKKAAGFISSIMSLANANPMLRQAAQENPRSIIAAAAIAATMDLPINPGLGFAHIVPYREHGGAPVAQFQMGWKGFVQLAIRTNLYKTIHATEIYEGELISYNRLSGETLIDEDKRTSEKIVGYIAYLRLNSGFEKTLYMSVDQVRKHAQRYSKAYSKPGTPWQVNFDAMALKTVVKQLLSKWGILSIEMQRAVQYDQGLATEKNGKETVSFLDNPESDAIDVPLVDENAGETSTPSAQKQTAQVTADEIFGEAKQ